MNDIKVLIDELSIAAREDAVVGIVGDRIVKILNDHATPQSAAKYLEAYQALVTAIRQDQQEGVKRATPVDDAAFRVLLEKVFDAGRAARTEPMVEGVAMVGPDRPYVLGQETRTHQAIEACLDAYSAASRVSEVTTDVAFGLLLERLVIAARTQGRGENFFLQEKEKQRDQDRVREAVAAVIRGRAMPADKGFDALLHDMLLQHRTMIALSVTTTADAPELKEQIKKFHAALDAVRGRYMGLDDRPPRTEKQQHEFLSTLNTLVVNARVAAGIEGTRHPHQTQTERDRMHEAQALEDQTRKKVFALFNA